MSHSSEASAKHKSSNPVAPTTRLDTARRNLVISVARDPHSQKKSKPTLSLGISQRHVENALGTIAPKAVLTLPPVPTSQTGQLGVGIARQTIANQSEPQQTKVAVKSSDVPSLINLQEVVTVGLPGVPGVEDDLTIRRRRPAVIQQLIQDQILRKPGLNINEVDDDEKFSVLQHYGCREETLDDLLLVTFHLIVKIPVQAAADIIVDMPDWMRRNFLNRFKLPPLLNELLASRIDGYEQPEDDIVAVMAEVVWSNALAAGSIAESAVTFFPPRFGRDSPLNRLKIDGSSKRVIARKEMLTTNLETVQLPLVKEVEDQDDVVDSLSGDSNNEMLQQMGGLKDVLSTQSEDDFLDLAQTFWGRAHEAPNGITSTGISKSQSEVYVDESITPTAPLTCASKELNTNRFDDRSSTIDLSTSLTLPAMPSDNPNGNAIPSVSKASEASSEANTSVSNQVSFVRLDDGNLVLL